VKIDSFLKCNYLAALRLSVASLLSGVACCNFVSVLPLVAASKNNKHNNTSAKLYTYMRAEVFWIGIEVLVAKLDMENVAN